MDREKIVILGNGFDLRHFLPTKYNHLITILREIENYNFSNSKVSFSDLFDGFFKEKEKFFYNGILNYYDFENIEFNSEKLKSIQERIKTNSWFQYLKSIEDNKIETWIDFETEINRVLNSISDYFDKFHDGTLSTIKKKYFSTTGSCYFIAEEVYGNKFFNNNFQRDILVLFGLFNRNKFSKSFTLNENYVVEIEEVIQYYKEKEFFDSIYNSLEEFTGIFNDYIVFIVNKFYRHFREEKKENFIINKKKLLFDSVSKIFSFNYTNTFDELFKINDTDECASRILSQSGKVENQIDQAFLHGRVIENWKEIQDLKMVLGVDDIEDSLKSNKLFQFTKYFQKLHKNTDYLFLDDILKSLEKFKTKDDKDYEFYFWGHSLDISDKDYINDVFKIVKIRDKSLIKIFYHSISGKADQLKNLLGIIDKNTIEDLMKKNRLIFLGSTPENLFKELV